MTTITLPPFTPPPLKDKDHPTGRNTSRLDRIWLERYLEEQFELHPAATAFKVEVHWTRKEPEILAYPRNRKEWPSLTADEAWAEWYSEVTVEAEAEALKKRKRGLR